MASKVRSKTVSRIIITLGMALLMTSLYFILSFRNLKIEIFNSTNYDIDSLCIGNKSYRIRKGTSLIIENPKSISMQAGIPFGLPDAKIVGKIKAVSHWFLCGTGVKKIKSGNYRFDIAIQEDTNSYTLYWKQHQ